MFVYICACACKHLGAARCSIAEDGAVGKVDGLILKQFTVASLIGCGLNPCQSHSQGGEERKEKQRVGVGLTMKITETIFRHTLHPKISCTLLYQPGKKALSVVQATDLLCRNSVEVFFPFRWILVVKPFPLTYTPTPLTV